MNSQSTNRPIWEGVSAKDALPNLQLTNTQPLKSPQYQSISLTYS